MLSRNHGTITVVRACKSAETALEYANMAAPALENISTLDEPVTVTLLRDLKRISTRLMRILRPAEASDELAQQALRDCTSDEAPSFCLTTSRGPMGSVTTLSIVEHDTCFLGGRWPIIVDICSSIRTCLAGFSSGDGKCTTARR